MPLQELRPSGLFVSNDPAGIRLRGSFRAELSSSQADRSSKFRKSVIRWVSTRLNRLSGPSRKGDGKKHGYKVGWNAEEERQMTGSQYVILSSRVKL